MSDKELEKEVFELNVFDYSLPKWKTDDGTISPDCTEEDNRQWAESVCDLVGTRDKDYMTDSLKNLATVIGIEGLNSAMAILRAINPADELESMLAVQMIAIHHLAITMMSRAAAGNQPFDVVGNQVNRSTKLTRTFLAQLETLNKHRGKGQQKMVVEHINVSEGGQAIVGNVGGG